MDNTKKQYLKLVGLLLAKKTTRLLVLAVMLTNAFFLCGWMIQGISFKGLVTITQNPFYPTTSNHLVDETAIANLLVGMFMIAAFLLFGSLALMKEFKAIAKMLRIGLFVFVAFAGVIYYGLNYKEGNAPLRLICTWYLVPAGLSICLAQLTTVAIEKIKREIIEQSDIFNFKVVTLDYGGFNKQWRNYLLVQRIEKTIDYDVAYPLIHREGKRDTISETPDILGESPRTVVTVRLKYTPFEVDFCSSPSSRYKEMSGEAKEAKLS